MAWNAVGTLAEITKRVQPPHACYLELVELDLHGLDLGSEARCSCGQMYRLQDDQRDGLYWQRTGDKQGRAGC